MHALAIVTVVTRNYIHYARALAQSVKEHTPQTPVVVVVADDPGPGFQPPSEWDHWLLAQDLGIANWRRFAFQYTPFELSCALKPHAVAYAWRLGYDRVAFCDGDMQVYSPLNELRSWLDTAAIVLTPHAHWSKMTPADDYEQSFLVSGVFNAGFFAVRRSPEAERFLQWWQARVAKHCIDDLPGGYCVDQKWLNLVPGMFGDVHIARHRGYNVGHWTLSYQPEIAWQDGRLQIAGDPLSIFHFSCFRPELPDLITHHPGCTTADFPALAPLCLAYAQRLSACNDRRYDQLGCAFAALSDGTPIDPLWREIIRQEHGRFAAVDDPFDVAAHPDLLERYRSLAPNFLNSRKAWRLKYKGVSPASPRGQLKRFGKELERVLRQLRHRGRAAMARLRLSLHRGDDSPTEQAPRRAA